MPNEEYYSGVEEGRDVEEHLSENELNDEESTSDNLRQDALKEQLEETANNLKKKTDRQLKALTTDSKNVEVKVKKFAVHLEGKLSELSGDGLKPKTISASSLFPFHIGQILKVEGMVRQSTFPCSIAVTIRGAKAPKPEIEIIDSDVKAHMLISPKETKGKFETLFETKATSLGPTDGRKKTDEQLSFEKKYAGVNSTNLRTKGVHKTIGTDSIELSDESPVLQYYLDNQHKMTVAQAMKNRFEHDLCNYVPATKSFVMHKECFEMNARDFENRLAIAKTASFDDLEIQFERARVSQTCKDDRWVDPQELKHYATDAQSMGRLLNLDQKLEMMFRFHYL